jgi:hypothetical protein
MQFQGVSTYGGRPAAVLDLIEAGGEVRAFRGFNLVDLETTLPLLSVQAGASRWRFSQVSCGE